MTKPLPIFCVMCVLLFAGPLSAQPKEKPKETTSSVEIDPASSQMASQVSNEILSPFCPGKTLAMCPSPDAARVRRQIQQLANDGRSKDEIKETIILEYGEEFRTVEPPSSDNFGLLAGIAGGLLLALLALYVFTRRIEGRDDDDDRDESQGSGSDENDPYLEELRKEYQS